MRQLWATGWMHNRVRMIAGSFLVKDLLLPWQDGARVVLGHAGGRRPRQQHAGLAVGGRLRRRRGAVLPRLQPGDAGPAVRPRRRLRAPLGAGAGRPRRRPRPRAVAGAARPRSRRPASRSARPIRSRSWITARPAPGRSPPTRPSAPADGRRPARAGPWKAAPAARPARPGGAQSRETISGTGRPSAPSVTSASVRGPPNRALPGRARVEEQRVLAPLDGGLVAVAADDEVEALGHRVVPPHEALADVADEDAQARAPRPRPPTAGRPPRTGRRCCP